MGLETTQTRHAQGNILTEYKEGCPSSERSGCLGLPEQVLPGSIQQEMGEKNQATDWGWARCLQNLFHFWVCLLFRHHGHCNIMIKHGGGQTGEEQEGRGSKTSQSLPILSTYYAPGTRLSMLDAHLIAYNNLRNYSSLVLTWHHSWGN